MATSITSIALAESALRLAADPLAGKMKWPSMHWQVDKDLLDQVSYTMNWREGGRVAHPFSSSMLLLAIRGTHEARGRGV